MIRGRRLQWLAPLALALGLTPAASGSAIALSWSNPEPVTPGHGLNGVACPSLRFCVAVGDQGRAVTSSNPAGSSSGWQPAVVDGANRLLSVSCAGPRFCLATDNHSRALWSTDPGGGVSAWTAVVIDPGRWINAVACPGPRLCVAVDRRGGVLASRNPAGSASAWKRIQVSHLALTSVSCPSTALCVASERSGRVFVATRPTGGVSAWRAVSAFRPPGGFPSLSAVSCAGVHNCVAAGIAVTDVYSVRTGNPTAGSRWSATYVDGQPHVGDVHAGLSCGSPTRCVLFDGSAFGPSSVFASTNSGRTWTTESLPSPSPEQAPTLSAVACLGNAFCVITDRAGNLTIGR